MALVDLWNLKDVTACFRCWRTVRFYNDDVDCNHTCCLQYLHCVSRLENRLWRSLKYFLSFSLNINCNILCPMVNTGLKNYTYLVSYSDILLTLFLSCYSCQGLLTPRSTVTRAWQYELCLVQNLNKPFLFTTLAGSTRKNWRKKCGLSSLSTMSALDSVISSAQRYFDYVTYKQYGSTSRRERVFGLILEVALRQSVTGFDLHFGKDCLSEFLSKTRLT